MQSIRVNGTTFQFEDADVAVASDGTVLPLPALQQVLGYDGSGNLTSVTVTYPVGSANTYKQTLSYTSGNLTNVSVYVKQ